jgi:DNA polymerase alpha subunit B
MNHEDPKINDSNIGLLNLSEENGGGISKIKLQLGEVPSYSFFEGEIVVAEGVYDSTQSKLNVSRIYKPTLESFERPSYSLEQLKKYSGEFYKERAIQVLVGAGPFTFRNSLGYQGLMDLLALAKKERPQVLILLGPFVDASNSEISGGDLFVI